MKLKYFQINPRVCYCIRIDENRADLWFSRQKPVANYFTFFREKPICMSL